MNHASEQAIQSTHGAAATDRREHAPRVVHVPRVDVRESKDGFLVVAELPGASQETVDITVEKNVLTISAKADTSAPEGYRRIYGPELAREYHRVFHLTEAIDRNGIRASMKNGVLRLTLAKASEALPRRIAVRADG